MSDPIVLLVDGEKSSREATLECLREQAQGATILPRRSLDEAKETLRNRAVDCVVTEYELPEASGLDLAAHVRETYPDAGFILYTATDRSEIDTEGSDETVTEFVDKDGPDAAGELWRVVRFTAEFRTQSAYPLPQNEEERLEALEAYQLDPEEIRPDVGHLTDLAAQYFDAPKASVNLIKEHSQEFLTCHGANWTPTAREDSICTYTILEENEVTLIGDVKSDPRFERNERLDEMGIRSYAGANLTTDDGLSIGTLCVYDDEPRTFSADDQEFLGKLSDVAMSIIASQYEASDPESGPAPSRGDEQ